MKAFAALIVMSMAAPAVPADSKPSDSQAQADTDTPKKERQICKRELTGTGLHSSRRVCLTAAQWKERSRNIEAMDDPRSRQVS